MNGHFIFRPKLLDFEYFSTCLNNLYPAIKYTLEKANLIQSDHFQPYQVLKFFDIQVILHSDNTIETEIYYKDTSAHDYRPYNSAQPKHCKDYLPYNLVIRIFAFISNDEKVEMRLKDLRN